MSRGLGDVYKRMVELFRRDGLEEIVFVRYPIDNVVEVESGYAFLLNKFQGKVTRGVDDQITLSGHSAPFNKRPTCALDSFRISKHCSVEPEKLPR